MKLICFSLWNNKPRYNVGAVQNAYLIQKYYPKWTARFYIHEQTDNIVVSELQSIGAQTILMYEESDWNASLWRFSAVKDNSVEVIICRDCDSRICPREVDAVEVWLRSPTHLHIMRDHPYHSDLILGGMWGAKKPIFDFIAVNVEAFLKSKNGKPEYGIDQEFLKLVYNQFKSQALIHDEFFEGTRFPSSRNGLKFVGQVYNEHGQTPREHLVALQYALSYQQHLRRYSMMKKTLD